MVTWAAFEAAAPELAAHGRRLLYQFDVGLGFLATVRRDGGPRLHPMCPILCDGALYAFIVTMSYKRGDLLRDGRYAMHTFPSPPPEPPSTTGDEEFYIDGRASRVDDRALRQRVVESTGGRLGTHHFEELWTFDVDRVLHTVWHNWATPQTYPVYTKWSPAKGLRVEGGRLGA